MTRNNRELTKSDETQRIYVKLSRGLGRLEIHTSYSFSLRNLIQVGEAAKGVTCLGSEGMSTLDSPEAVVETGPT